MKGFKLILVIAVLFSINVFRTAHAQSNISDVTAKGAVLMEVTTGRVLYKKNENVKLPMASTTKIMTAIIAIESGKLSETVTVGANAVGVEGSSIYLQLGEKLTLEELVYGLMLASGNDAAVAIAEHVGGDVDSFVKLMNKKAKEIGANSTNFINPNGLHNDSHYTTAYDLALIASYGMKNEKFKEIVGTKEKRIPYQGKEYPRVLRNKNRILAEYSGGNGVKTGYTKAAGRCLVSSAQRNGMQVVCAVINAPDMFNDCKRIMDKGFENYTMKNIIEADKSYGSVAVAGSKKVKNIQLATEKAINYPLTADEEKRLKYTVKKESILSAPIKSGTQAGSVVVELDGQNIGAVSLVTKGMAKSDDFMYNLKEFIKNIFR